MPLKARELFITRQELVPKARSHCSSGDSTRPGRILGRGTSLFGRLNKHSAASDLGNERICKSDSIQNFSLNF